MDKMRIRLKLKSKIKKMLWVAAAILVPMSLAMGLSGCHGSRERVSFNVPDTFDETGDFEITFWAKNDTNKTQTAIYEKAISDFRDVPIWGII